MGRNRSHGLLNELNGRGLNGASRGGTTPETVCTITCIATIIAMVVVARTIPNFDRMCGE